MHCGVGKGGGVRGSLDLHVGCVFKLLRGVQECFCRWSFRSNDKGSEQRAYFSNISLKRAEVARFCTTINKICSSYIKNHILIQTVKMIFG